MALYSHCTALKAKLADKESKELHSEEKIRLLESQYSELVAQQSAALNASVHKDESFSAEAELAAERLEWLQERQRMEKEAAEMGARLEQEQERL